PLLLSGLITLILWQFPWGRLALYPFTLMATYAHEMGHGLTALAVGGRFHSLLMFPDGSGVARHAVGSGAAAALVAAGGLVGPAVAGAILMASTRRASRARWVLFMLGIGMALSIILYVRGSFAQSFVGLVAVSLLLLARYTSTQVALLSVQFLGLQLCLAVFKDLDYMFSPGGYVGGRLMRSDSAAIAEVLLLPYWFWGALTAVFSFVVIGLGLRQVLKPTPPSPRT
ncbi:MAG: M50 family metallopeptidase, partial [Myxococcota bacterium]